MYFYDGVVDDPCQCEGNYTFRSVHNVGSSSILPLIRCRAILWAEIYRSKNVHGKLYMLKGIS